MAHAQDLAEGAGGSLFGVVGSEVAMDRPTLSLIWLGYDISVLDRILDFRPNIGL